MEREGADVPGIKMPFVVSKNQVLLWCPWYMQIHTETLAESVGNKRPHLINYQEVGTGI